MYENTPKERHLSQQARLGIASRAEEPGPCSNREELLPALDRLVRERVGQRPSRRGVHE